MDYMTDQFQPTDVLEEAVQALGPGEVLLGTMVDITDKGAASVRVILGNQSLTLEVTSVIPLCRAYIGRQAVIMLAGGGLRTPVLMGLVHSPLDMVLEKPLPEVEKKYPPAVEVDGQTTLVEGDRKVVLRCGAASITLTAEGKILLRGQHLVSRSDGVNRVLGAAVQLN
ncbi:DUF6484 domain-containing protein [Marinimicrobium sp. ARAG 43.8]|uniref:DUF6484 domain-containing protein n=1 Tax=Marinimicrobium sp. ARAG 43.8 TaxID=3418719 RepID=UPI003CEFBDA9